MAGRFKLLNGYYYYYYYYRYLLRLQTVSGTEYLLRLGHAVFCEVVKSKDSGAAWLGSTPSLTTHEHLDLTVPEARPTLGLFHSKSQYTPC